jgi:hypothetical protein
MVAGVLRMQVDNARAIRRLEDDCELGNERSNAIATTVSTLAYNFAQKFAADNPRFDHVKFYEAAGFKVYNNYPVVFEGQRG